MGTERIVRWIFAAGRVWLAIELSAGIVALCLLVALLPGIEILMALPSDWSWKVAIPAVANSTVCSAFLGRRALAIPAELVLDEPKVEFPAVATVA